MKLLGRTGQVAGRDVTVSSRMRIGAAEDNDLRLVVRGVSRHHARITRDGNEYWIEDAGSTNGTFLNAQRISEPAVLRSGDVVSIAGIRQFRMSITGDTTRQVPQNIIATQSVPSHAREWQTRLVWSADELAQLERERGKVMDDAQHV